MATLMWLVFQRRTHTIFGRNELSTRELVIGVVVIAVAVLAIRPWRR